MRARRFWYTYEWVIRQPAGEVKLEGTTLRCHRLSEYPFY